MKPRPTKDSIRKTMETLKEIWKPTEPAPVGMTLVQLDAHKSALRASLSRLNAIKPNCHSCNEFDLGACKKHGDIPAEFQSVEGECPDWTYDAIPF